MMHIEAVLLTAVYYSHKNEHRKHKSETKNETYKSSKLKKYLKV